MSEVMDLITKERHTAYKQLGPYYGDTRCPFAWFYTYYHDSEATQLAATAAARNGVLALENQRQDSTLYGLTEHLVYESNLGKRVKHYAKEPQFETKSDFFGNYDGYQTKVKYCDHTKQQHVYAYAGSRGSVIHHQRVPYANGTTHNHTSDCTMWNAMVDDERMCWARRKMPPPTLAELPVDNAWLNRALASSEEAVQPDFDFMAELVQLKDLKSAVRSVASIGKYTRTDLSRIISRALKGETSFQEGRKKALKVVKDAVGAHLAMKWGVLPTIQDCRELAVLHKTAIKQYEAFKRRVSSGEGRYYSGHELPKTFDTQVGTYPYTQGTYWVSTLVITLRREDEMCGQYGYSVRQVYDLLGQGLPDFESYVAKRLGVDKPYKTAWELVPYSFVMDYFFAIDDAINRFESASSEIRIKIVDPCLTSKWVQRSTYSLSATVNWKDNSNGNVIHEWVLQATPIGYVDRTHFHREKGEIQPHFLEETWKERMFTLSELAIQRVTP